MHVALSETFICRLLQIVNLQEVQSDDFKDYLLPELEKLGRHSL